MAVLKQFFYNKLEGRVLLPLGNNSAKNLKDEPDFSDIDLSEEEEIRDTMLQKSAGQLEPEPQGASESNIKRLQDLRKMGSIATIKEEEPTDAEDDGKNHAV